MKKIILSGLTAIVLTMSFIACKKTANNVSTTPVSTSHSYARPFEDGGDKPVTTFDGTKCVLPADRCLPEIIVHPKFDECPLSTGLSSTEVGHYFSSVDGIEFANNLHIGSIKLEELASGNYSIMFVNTTVPNEKILLAGPSTTLTLQNSEFQIPVTFSK